MRAISSKRPQRRCCWIGPSLDAEPGRRIDGGPGRAAFIQYFIANEPDVHDPDPFRPWRAYVEKQVSRAMHDGDRAAFVDRLRREAWLLSDVHVKFQVGLIEEAVLSDRGSFITALFDLDPAVLRIRVPPPPLVSSQAIEHAFTCEDPSASEAAAHLAYARRSATRQPGTETSIA